MAIGWGEVSIAVDVTTVSLDAWTWLLGPPLRPVMVTAFGDVFLMNPAGATVFLDTVWGELLDVPGGLDAVRAELERGSLTKDWFRLDLLTAARQAHRLGAGACFQFVVPPALGGAADAANVDVGALALHLGLMGQVHAATRQLRDRTHIARFVDGADDEP